MIRNFDPIKERLAQKGNEWQFGSIGIDLAAIPVKDRAQYLPAGVLQFNNVMDTNGCASRMSLNILETKLDYFWDHGMHQNIKNWFEANGYRVNGKFALCDAFIEILSGTTKNGNSLKAPIDAIYKYGVIPAALLPLQDNMTWEQYMDPKRITQKYKDLGEEFNRRIQFNYEQVPLAKFKEALDADLLGVAGHAWPAPVDGIYPKNAGDFNHAFETYTGEIDIFDNYQPFNKRLAKDYAFFEWGYSLSITNQVPYPDETMTLFETLQKLGLLAFFAEALKRLINAPVAPPDVPVIPKPTPMPPVIETNAHKLYEIALLSIGKDLSTEVSNDVACAESVTRLVHEVYPDFPIIVGTAALYQALKADKRFKATLTPEPGCVVVSPTGMGKTAHGHTGILGEGDKIMSNGSSNGKWAQNYTVASWVAYFRTANGYPVYFFLPL